MPAPAPIEGEVQQQKERYDMPTPTREEKLAALLNNIERNRYDAVALANMLVLQRTIADDINCEDPAEAMALLGWLLKSEYVTIDPERGIILNPDKGEDIQLLRTE